MIDLAALLQTASLGDKRLDRRALTLVGDIIKGQASATHGPEGVGHRRPWAHAMGAFRFFDNAKLSLPALYEPCRVALPHLVPQGERTYVVHDVSVVDFTAHQGRTPEKRGSRWHLRSDGAVVKERGAHEFIPAASAQEGPQVKQVLRMSVEPEHAIGLEALVDDLPDGTLDSA